VVVIGDERHIGKALSGLPPATWLLVRERVGHRGMMLISNDRWGQNVPSVHDALRLIEE
jgi:hypothetical protein